MAKYSDLSIEWTFFVILAKVGAHGIHAQTNGSPIQASGMTVFSCLNDCSLAINYVK